MKMHSTIGAKNQVSVTKTKKQAEKRETPMTGDTGTVTSVSIPFSLFAAFIGENGGRFDSLISYISPPCTSPIDRHGMALQIAYLVCKKAASLKQVLLTRLE